MCFSLSGNGTRISYTHFGVGEGARRRLWKSFCGRETERGGGKWKSTLRPKLGMCPEKKKRWRRRPTDSAVFKPSKAEVQPKPAFLAQKAELLSYLVRGEKTEGERESKRNE